MDPVSKYSTIQPVPIVTANSNGGVVNLQNRVNALISYSSYNLSDRLDNELNKFCKDRIITTDILG